AKPPATVAEGAYNAGLVAAQFLHCRRSHGQFVQMEMRQLDVHNIPRLGVQLFTAGRVQGAFGLFHQPIIALVLPARENLGIVAPGMEIALEKAIRIEAEGIALDQPVKLALLTGIEVRHRIERLQGHLEPYAVPKLLDDLGTFTVEREGDVADDLDRGAHSAGRLE